jgi:formylglycine-generating enzyme required for sulfatase activity
VVLALISPLWLDAKDRKGRRRIDTGSDFVRLELVAALGRPGVLVVPLLIDGTEMPAEDDLPADLHPLLRRQGMALRIDSFDADMGHLAAHLKRILAASAAPVAVTAPPPAQLAPVAPPPSEPRPAWASDAGRDDYGRWAEFTVGGVQQRLRWIAPGEFLMGSPASEVGRSNDEGPQHRVRLTRGFWLADTVCTQALWLAVVGGKNPAKFADDPLNPVEQVSHEDAERFLETLRGRLGGAAAALPTEAEWEYACRAGTGTAYSWGNQADDTRANFSTKLGKTTPVKRYPPNPWGLYDMHGNVWEWCADDWRTYADTSGGQAVIDPVVPQKPGPEARRALRGGSWFGDAGGARSAYRFHNRRGFRNLFLGFRLALRS